MWEGQIFNLIMAVLAGSSLSMPLLDYYLVKKRKISGIIAITSILLVLLLDIVLFLNIKPSAKIYGGLLEYDFFALCLAILASLNALLLSIASLNIEKEWTTSPSYFSLILITLAGLHVIFGTSDLIVVIVSWALVSVASYTLVGIRKDEASAEGAVKYALMGVVSTGLILYASAFFTGMGGELNIASIASIGSRLGREAFKIGEVGGLLMLALIMLTAAIGFKIGLVPFHWWLPDVYGGVDPLLVSYLSGIVKLMGIAVLVRIIEPLLRVMGFSSIFYIMLIAVLTMTFGNLVALVQNNFQRMLAYSSIAHMGYILLGVLAATNPEYYEIALLGVLLHMVTYTLAKLGLFLTASYFKDKGLGLEYRDIEGVGFNMPLTSISAAILLLNLIGMPPLLGFWSKFVYIFLTALPNYAHLVAIAFLNSAISVGYYARALRYFFFGVPKLEIKEEVEPKTLVIAITAFSTIILGLIIGFT